MSNKIKVIQIIVLFLLGGCHHTYDEGFDYLGTSQYYCNQNIEK